MHEFLILEMDFLAKKMTLHDVCFVVRGAQDLFSVPLRVGVITQVMMGMLSMRWDLRDIMNITLGSGYLNEEFSNLASGSRGK